MSWPVWSRASSSGFRGRNRMVQRSRPSADTRRGRDGAVNEIQPVRHRGLERPAQRKAGGDRG